MTNANHTTTETTTNDIYSRITDKIIADLEKGELSWRKPWASGAGDVSRPLRSNGKPYTGINVLVLWAIAAEKSFVSPIWLTLNQANELNARVRKGEKGTTVVYTNSYDKKEENGEGIEVKNRRSFLKTYTVFNADQIDGLPEHFYHKPEPKIQNPDERSETVDAFFAQTGAEIILGGEAAYHHRSDRIEMPAFKHFTDARSYYGILAHEITHWTKHPARLNRYFGGKQFGDEGYAKEELVAELGACYLAADLGFAPKPLEENVAYVQSWLKVLKDNKRFIFSAAFHAQKAAEFCWSMQPETFSLHPENVAA